MIPPAADPAQAAAAAQAAAPAGMTETGFSAQQMHTLERIYERATQSAIEVATKALGKVMEKRDTQNEFQTDTRATGKLESLRRDGSNWTDYAIRLKSHVRAQSAELADLMEKAEDQKYEVDEIDLLEDKLERGARALQHLLTMSTSSTNLKRVKSTKDGNGIVSWQKLCGQWDTQSEGLALAKLVTILQTDFNNERTFAETMVLFNDHIEEWEKQTEEKMPDSIKTAVVAKSAPLELSNYIRLIVPNNALAWSKRKRWTSS